MSSNDGQQAAPTAPEELYRRFRHRTKKSLGQHFLIDAQVLHEIVTLADVRPDDPILEIGPGCGTLTLVLLQRGAVVEAVELDRRAVQFLKKELEPHFSLTVHPGSALDVDLEEIFSSTPIPWKVVANLPYNVASKVLFRLFEYREHIDEMTLMFQREVADRIVAEPGDSDYGALTLMSRLYSQVHMPMTLPAGAFVPPPKVRSAIVQFRLIEGTRIDDPTLRKTFEKVVKAAFQHRRKTLANGLKGLSIEKEAVESALESMGLKPKIRPQKLAFEEFLELTRCLVDGGEI